LLELKFEEQFDIIFVNNFSSIIEDYINSSFFESDWI